MRTAREVPTLLLWRNSIISRMTFCSPAGDDPLRPLGPDSRHLTQATWLLLDDVEHGLAEGAHELLRINRPDAADHPGAEIFFDPLDPSSVP
jgi:hypothetical protein